MKSNLNKLYLFTFLLCTALACVEVQDANEKSKENVSVAQVPTGESEHQESIEYEIEESSQVNEFSVRLQFPQGQFLLRKFNNESLAEPETLVKDSYLDQHVQAGESYTYELGYKTNSSFQVVYSKKIQIPFDLYVQGQVLLTDSMQIQKLSRLRKLIFFKDSELVTNGFQVQINAEILVSEGGHLSTFVNGTTSAQNVHGRSGGEIKLSAKQASGFLFINMRGENGANGANGSNAPNKVWPLISGGNGGAGTNGGFSGRVYISLPSDLKVQVQHFPGQPGQGGPGGIGTETERCIRGNKEFDSYCDKFHGDNGSAGSPGAPGAMGQTCFLSEEKEVCQ